MAGTARSGGHNRKSVHAHRLQGTFQPGRHRDWSDGPAASAPVSLEPPAHLDGDARAAWTALVDELSALGVVSVLDLPKLELLAIHLGLHRSLYRRWVGLQLPAVGQAATANAAAVDASRLLRSLRQEAEVIRGLSAGFGLDPSDRRRLDIRPPHVPNTFDEFEAALT